LAFAELADPSLAPRGSENAREAPARFRFEANQGGVWDRKWRAAEVVEWLTGVRVGGSRRMIRRPAGLQFDQEISGGAELGAADPRPSVPLPATERPTGTSPAGRV